MIEELKNIKVLEESPSKGIFEIQPLNPGFGLTIGNAIRRVLLSSLKGYCISAIKIEGVSHEFSTINGIIEDVTEIILNIKKVCLKKQITTENDYEFCKISITDQEVITAGDLGKCIHSFQVLNPDLIICHKDKLIPFNLSFVIKDGKGYISAEEQEFKFDLAEELNFKTDFIPIDGIFSPIIKVKYKIESCLVGKRIDYEKLILELVTNSSICPKDALMDASQILIDHFKLFLHQNINNNEHQLDEKKIKNEEINKKLQLKISDLGFSPRTINGLSLASIETLGQLVSHNEDYINGIRNLGVKSRDEIKAKLKEKGLYLGMTLDFIKK